MRLYGPFVDALKQAGMREYRTHLDEDQTPTGFRPERLTADGCDVSHALQPESVPLPLRLAAVQPDSAKKLKDFMGCVRKFYTGPVVLAAHSMGGLLSRRRYILDNPAYSNSVNQLVTIGSPWLGAPNSLTLSRPATSCDFYLERAPSRKFFPPCTGLASWYRALRITRSPSRPWWRRDLT